MNNAETSSTYAALKQRVRDIVTGYMTFKIEDDASFVATLKDYNWRSFDACDFADAIEQSFGMEMSNEGEFYAAFRSINSTTDYLWNKGVAP